MVSNRLDVAKRQHRERAQPLHRRKLGILEKHKDYVLRARDYHSKQDRLKRLREKAFEKNKDEFYFGMVKGRTEGGVHVQARESSKVLDDDLVRLLKSQDVGYVRTLRAIENKNITRIKEQLASRVDLPLDQPLPQPSSSLASITPRPTKELTLADVLRQAEDDLEDTRSSARVKGKGKGKANDDGPSGPRRTVFVDSLDEVKNFEPAKRTRRDSTLVNKGKGKADLMEEDSEEEGFETESESEDEGDGAKDSAQNLLTELSLRLARSRALSRVLKEMELQKLLMTSKGSKRRLDRAPKGAGLAAVGDDDEDQVVKKKGDARTEGEEGMKTGIKIWKWKAERRR